MSFYKGAAEVDSVHIGSTDVAAVYLGADKVWPVGPAIVAEEMILYDGPSAGVMSKSIPGLVVPLANCTDGSKVFVGDVMNGHIKVVDPATSSFVDTVEVNTGVMQLSASTSAIYVAGNNTSGFVKNEPGWGGHHPVQYNFAWAIQEGAFAMSEFGPYFTLNGVIRKKVDGSVVGTVTFTADGSLMGAVGSGSKLYLSTAKTVYVIDIITESVIKQIPFGSVGAAETPKQLVSTGGNVYVTTGEAKKVLQINTSTDTVVKEFLVADTCNGVAVSKTQLLASCENANQVAIFNRSTAALIKKVPVGLGPRHICIVGNKAFVNCSGSARVDVIT